MQFLSLIFLSAIAIAISNVDDHRYFYIYETGDWPSIATASFYRRDKNERLQNVMNFGAGPTVDERFGEYHTDQYQLYSMIYNRALKDHRRTLDPSNATSFFIPYDFASDAAYYKDCARSEGVCFDFRKCPLAPTVEELLSESPWYKRHGGRDHVLVVGMNYAMDHYILKPKCKSLLSATCANCTKFAIDDYSFMYASNGGIEARGDFWHAVPFPGNFHWHRQVQRPFPWENSNRPIVSSYIGSTKSFYGPARRLRGSIAHYCSQHSKEECVHNTYGLNGTRFSFRVDGHRPMQLSQQSVFCFQPIGDLMTRKGLFDSLLQGCIPVVFDALTAAVMYTWHWEEAFWKQVVVEYPFHPTAHRYFDPVADLVKLYKNNQSDISRRQELIRSRVFQLQYGLDGRKDVYQYRSGLPYVSLLANDSTVLAAADAEGRIYHTTRLVPPSRTAEGLAPEEIIDNVDSNWPRDSDGLFVDDAYDIIVELFLGWHSGQTIRFRNATVTECWDGWLDTVQNRCRLGEKPK